MTGGSKEREDKTAIQDIITTLQSVKTGAQVTKSS
jgi:hypothetical protein